MRRTAIVVSAPPTNRVTLSFKGPAVLDEGITIYPASAPLYLDEDMIGQSIREEIFAITTVAPQNITMLDIFEP